MPQIYDMGQTALLPLRKKRAEDFFALKNPTASAGFEPANLGTKGLLGYYCYPSFGFSTSEDGTARLSRNVCKKLQLLAA
jgi:hypothetical protein